MASLCSLSLSPCTRMLQHQTQECRTCTPFLLHRAALRLSNSSLTPADQNDRPKLHDAKTQNTNAKRKNAKTHNAQDKTQSKARREPPREDVKPGRGERRDLTPHVAEDVEVDGEAEEDEEEDGPVHDVELVPVPVVHEPAARNQKQEHSCLSPWPSALEARLTCKLSCGQGSTALEGACLGCLGWHRRVQGLGSSGAQGGVYGHGQA
eukprot:3894207-Rhodomonas_salina.1